MHKSNAAMQTRNKPISSLVAVVAVMVFAFGGLLWVWAAFFQNKPASMLSPSMQMAVEDQVNKLDGDRLPLIEPEDQIVFSRVSLEKISRNAAAFQQFKNEITEATQNESTQHFEVNGTVERLTSFKTCVILTYLMVQDFFTGGSEVDKIFIAEVEKLDHISRSSVNKAVQAIYRLSAALTIIEDSYSERFVSGPGTTSIGTGLADDIIGGGGKTVQARDQKLVRTIAFNSSLGSASALLSSMAFAKSANHSVWSLFGGTRKKVAKRIGVAAIPALLDGPLPFGDIAAMVLESGCLAWSFHEVYQAQGALKGELINEISGVITQNYGNIREWSMEVGDELMGASALTMSVFATDDHPKDEKKKRKGVESGHRLQHEIYISTEPAMTAERSIFNKDIK